MNSFIFRRLQFQGLDAISLHKALINPIDDEVKS